MQTQIQSCNDSLQPFKNKFTNLTVKQIELNLQNQRGIINACNNSNPKNSNSNNNANYNDNKLQSNNNNIRRPFKMFQPRRNLAPLIRKQLPVTLFNHNNNNQRNSNSHNNHLKIQNQNSSLSLEDANFSFIKRNQNSNIGGVGRKRQGSHKVNQTQPSISSEHQQQPTRLQSGKSNGRNTFLLNSIIEILKTGDDNQNPNHPNSSLFQGNQTNTQTSSSVKKVHLPKRIHLKTQPSTESSYNQFTDLRNIGTGSTTTKNKRGPKVLENQITRLGNHNNVIRSRKLYSQEKARIHHRNRNSNKNSEFDQLETRAGLGSAFGRNNQGFTNSNNMNVNVNVNNANSRAVEKSQDQLQNVQILTFYKNTNSKNCKTEQSVNYPFYDQQENDNQFIFEARK